MITLQTCTTLVMPSYSSDGLGAGRCCLGISTPLSTSSSSFRGQSTEILYRGRSFCSIGALKFGGFIGEGLKHTRFLSKDWILTGRRLVAVKANPNPFGGFNGGGGGGGGWDKNNRVLVNLALAVGLTYLTMTGQLGWVVDAIVSVWLLAVILPIVGLGAFFWFAGRDIVQSNCPNCGNDFQIFRSSLNDGPQLCPFCSQPFSVQGDKFVREAARFSSDRSTTYAQTFNEYSPRSEKGKGSTATVVDIEAEVKDIDS